VIHYLNGREDIVQRLDELKEQGLGLSLTSLAELYEGIYYSTDPDGNERDLQDFLQGVDVIGIDEETCQVFGRQCGRLRAAGRTVGDFDLLIGATALQHNAIPLTNNRRHFELIEGLQLESR
jgi:tRNA(fMet)-specific endonuclease VapC